MHGMLAIQGQAIWLKVRIRMQNHAGREFGDKSFACHFYRSDSKISQRLRGK